MEKRLIKCSTCKHTFFTKKVILTKTEIQTQSSKLDADLKNFEKYLKDLEIQHQLIIMKINKTKQTIKEINKDVAELDTVVQCSECGERINALECEVKT